MKMTLSYRVLQVLSDGQLHSGESLGQTLGVSRTAIWKVIKQLQQRGLDIHVLSGSGYRIIGGLTLLDKSAILECFHTLKQAHPPQILLFDSLDSTNAYAQKSALPSNTLVIAEEQTQGKGRQGRKWLSPFASNLYCSFVWHFMEGPARLAGMSLLVGLCVVKALEDLGVTSLGLKWPNDILYQGHKLAGILVEVQGDLSGPCQTVIGIGLNVAMPMVYHDDIPQKTTDLFAITGKKYSRNTLVANIINTLRNALPIFEEKGWAAFHAKWQQYDCLRFADVTVIQGERHYDGRVLGVDTKGNLQLDSHGKALSFTSGEVSIKKA